MFCLYELGISLLEFELVTHDIRLGVVQVARIFNRLPDDVLDGLQMIFLKLGQPVPALHHCLKGAHCSHLFVLFQLPRHHLRHLLVPKHHLRLLLQRILQLLLCHHLRLSHRLTNRLRICLFIKCLKSLARTSLVKLELSLSLLLPLVPYLILIVKLSCGLSGLSAGMSLVLLCLQNLMIVEPPLPDLWPVLSLLLPLH